MNAFKEIFHPVKKEFRREKCGFDHTPPDDFVKSQWQNRTKSTIYLIYRWFLALFFTAVVIESMIDPDDSSNFWLYFIYMTNWGIMLCMVSNLYAAILVSIWHFHPEYADKLLNLESLKSPFRIYWAIHITTLVVSIVITIIYWTILYDANEGTISATNILTHAFNSICMFVDLLIVAHPLRLLHMFLPVCFGLFYAFFSVIYQWCGGHNKKGKPYIYHVIDWNEPVKSSLTVVGVLLLCCCVYMALFTIYKLRTLLYRRLNNATFILPTTAAPSITKKHVGTGIKHSPSGISMVLDASAAQDTGEQGNEWNRTQNPNSANGDGGRVAVGSAQTNAIDIQNAGKIKFDPPKVPVIFVLGGPGSGKVTHCDTFMQERRGVTHINMMDLLQQYAMGNDMQDFSQLSSKTVTEVLMLEMKMAPAAKVYLISGYPRSMRDVVEYSEKIQVVNGVILISWRQSVLQKQIDYGAKLGHVVLSLAKMELENFFKNVMPVADYFDQSDMLIAVNGERAPSEVYKDFRGAVLDILSSLENQEAILNGVTGMGRGINDIPGSIVSVDTAPSQAQNIPEMSNHNAAQISTVPPVPPSQMIEDPSRNITNAVISHVASNAAHAVALSGVADVITRQPMLTNAATSMTTDMNALPPVIWVIGGPGSNKATLCMKAVGLNAGWVHFSVGRLLRSITDSAPRANTESYAVKEALAAGEMAPEKIVNLLLESNLKQMSDKTGIIIDGFPRNMQQVKYFEDKYKKRPPIILLDCSKLQLGRGRIDDTVSSFRRRLELFREQTLPMLKAMDNSSRLQIIDGDTDSPSVQREFEKSIRNHIQNLTGTNQSNNIQGMQSTTTATRPDQQTDTILQDLENNVPGAVPTISHHVSLMNGHIKNRNTSATNQLANNNKTTSYMNGDIGQTGQTMDFRHMLEEAERYPVDSYM